VPTIYFFELDAFKHDQTPLKLNLEDLAERPFVILITSYNNEFWCEKNVRSALFQEYRNFRLIYIDDCSLDNTAAKVQTLLKRSDNAKRVTFIQNEKQQGSLANIVVGCHLCDPREIVVSLDGDDWLKDDQVLKTLNQIYANRDVWLTYGNYEYSKNFFKDESPSSFTSEIPHEVIASNSYRDYPWVTSHLKTFYAGLFQKIKKADLQLDGNFFSMTGDLAFMIPMVEMAAFHTRHIPQILYVYNTQNPISDFRKGLALVYNLEAIIRAREPYLPLEKLYTSNN
jgi:glycosyltransferase involved in cell wall biosynthesis